MTPRHPPAPRGSVQVLTRTGNTRHDAFVGAKRTVCGGVVAKLATDKHMQRIGFCRRCMAFRRRGVE